MGANLRPTPSTADTVRHRLESLPRRFRLEAANGLVAEWELRIGAQSFTVAVGDHRCVVREGPGKAPSAVITTEPDVWLAIDEGRLSGGRALLERDLGVVGNLDLAMRLNLLFRPFRRPVRPGDLDQVEYEADGLKLSAYVMGRGAPVVILHGLGGGKVSVFPLIAEIAESHRVIVPDLPGHGESDKPVAEYSPRFYARVIRHLLDEVGADQAVVIGNSLGGRIALELALRSPMRVAALALLGPALPGLRWRYVMGFTRVFPSEFGAIPFPLRERWMRALLRRLFADPTAMPEKALTAAAHEFIRVYRSPAARMAFLASLRQIVTERPEPFFESLRRIKQPTLVMFGEQDRIVPARLGARLAQRMPNAELVVLPNVGHVPQFEAARATLDVLKAFMAGAPAGSPQL
jgi:pimeloyl-ACP methyl ester carboxylesterase/putative sterol carrier protein